MDTETRRKMLLASAALEKLADKIRAGVLREDSRMFPEEWEAKLPGVMYAGALRVWRSKEQGARSRERGAGGKATTEGTEDTEGRPLAVAGRAAG